MGDTIGSLRHPIVRRWVEIGLYAIAASALWLLGPAVVDPSLEQAAAFIARGGSSAIILATGLLILAQLGWFARNRWWAFFGVRHPLRWPSIWVSAAIAILVVSIVRREGVAVWMGRFEDARWAVLETRQYVWWILGSFFVGILIDDMVRRGPSVRRAAATIGRRLDPISGFEAIREWARSDDEVTDPDLDQFGHRVVAERIAARLASSDPSWSKTTALIGPLGSGKSTIRAFVATILDRKEPPSPVRSLHISLWRYESPEAAIRAILRVLTRELAVHVAVFPLRGIPSRYLEIVESVGGRWGALARLFRGLESPGEVLDEMAVVFEALNFRIALWVEDLERFVGTEGLDGKEARLYEAERLRPVRAFLYQLHQSPSICVIIADTTLRTRFDIEKIARFLEAPPSLDPELVWMTLGTVRTACLRDWPKEVIDPAPEDERSLLDIPDRSLSNTFARHLCFAGSRGEDNPTVWRSVVHILDTPRKLKSAIRLFIEDWSRLAGEIDLDDLLVLSTIRIGDPDAFVFIHQRFGTLSTAEVLRDAASPEMQEQRAEALRQLDAILAHRAPPQRNATIALIAFLFAGVIDDDRLHPRPHRRNRPQGIDREGYWERYLGRQVEPGAPSDQVVLEAIDEWKQGGDRLERLFLDGVAADQIERFTLRLRPSDLMRLLQHATRVLCARDPANWEGAGPVPELDSLGRMFREHRFPEAELRSSLETAIETAIPLSAVVAHGILHGFAVRELLSGDAPESVFRFARDELVRQLSSDPRALVQGMRNTPARVFFWLCDLCQVSEDNKSWDRLRSILRRASKDDCHLVRQIVAMFVMKPGPEPRFAVESAKKLFDAGFIRTLFHGAQLDTEASSYEEKAVQEVLRNLGQLGSSDQGPGAANGASDS